MNYVKLGTLIKIISGYPFDSDFFNNDGKGVPLIRVRDVNNGFTGLYYSGTYNDSFIIDKDDLLIGLDGDFKCKVWSDSRALLNQRVCKIVPIPNLLDKDYLRHFLPNALSNIHDSTNFTTVKHLATKAINHITIPLPSIAEQKTIARNLTVAESLIFQRKESIRLLDEFLKSTFLEMFGDPVRNDKRWETIPLKMIIEGIESGWSPVCLKNSRSNDSEWAVLKLSSVTYKKFNPNENKLLDPDIIIKKKLEPTEGDILFVRKNTYNLIGATTYIFENYKRLLLPDTIFRINYKKDLINGLYLLYLFNDSCFRKLIQSLASGAAGSMPNISKEKLMKLVIPVPPISLQMHFAEIVLKNQILVKQYDKNLQLLTFLYSSICQKTYYGEFKKL